jgi:hypothetical protein
MSSLEVSSLDLRRRFLRFARVFSRTRREIKIKRNYSSSYVIRALIFANSTY